jgi:NAD dependent epimerase/dehydratase family enzyme
VENLDVRGALNATAPWPVRNEDFTAALARSLHRPAFLTAPAFALRLMLREFSHELLDSKRVLPAAATAQDFGFRFPQITPALADIVA